jgi:hypothetical protein
MKSLLELIKLLYGPKAISSTIGTRTNVIRLPSGKLQRYLKEGLNIEAASDNAAQNAYNEMKELIPEVAKMNDAERLIFEGNLRRLKNKLEASGLIQGENVTSGIAAIESKAEQLKQAGKELEEITKPKSIIGDIMKDYSSFQKIMQEERRKGLVRATTRSILYQDIKTGKIKNMTLEELGSVRDPINNFREIYGERALEQLDSLADNFAQMTTAEEAATFAKTKFKFEPRTNTLPETTTIEEGKKAEQEFEINKPTKVSDFKAEATKRTSIDDLIDEYNTNQDRLRLSDEEGGTAIGYEEFQKIQKRNEDIAKALEDKGISSKVEEAPQAEIIPFRKKPTEPEGKADGGRIGYAYGTPAMGLDYLTGMEPSKGYADGERIKFKAGGGKKILDLINKANKELKGKKSMETVNPKTGEVTAPKEPVKTAEKQTKEFTDDEMMAYIKKYKEEGPTLEEFTKKINKETGSNFTPEQLERAHRIKVAYPHSTPIVDSQGNFIGGGLYNPPLDVSISDRETLTKSIVQTRKTKGLSVPKKYQEELKSAEVVETPETPPKAGEGRFTKQQVLEKIIQSTIKANPTDEYVQTTFPNFIKEIRANPELANNENVWKTFTQDFPENKRLVVYGDDTVDFFTKGENLPEGMKQTQDLVNTYGISMEEARRIKQMEPSDQVMEIKKLQISKSKPQKEMSLEEEMNMVLNQYDKSMFIKNDQGMVDVTNPENVQKMAILLKKDHPEIYKRLEEGTPTNVLEEFDVTGRKPNANGGLNYLMGL